MSAAHRATGLLRCFGLAGVLPGVLALAGAAWGQIAISTRAGMILHSEGAVFVDGAPLSLPAAQFVYLEEAESLHTGDGRAEILLGDTSFVRLGKHSRVEMLAAEVADSRVRLAEGSAVVDVWFLDGHSTVTVHCGEVEVGLLKRGRYRFDVPATAPATVRVFHGRVGVKTGRGAITVRRGQLVKPTAGEAKPSVVEFDFTQLDALDLWNAERQARVEKTTRAAARSQSWLR